MVTIQEKCHDCQQNKTVSIGQSFIDGLRWYESHHCFFCGSAMEVDDRGFPPEYIRKIIIQQDGEYYLKVDPSYGDYRVISVKIIRQSLRLNFSDTKQLLQEFPILATGTEIEMKWLQSLLLIEGIFAKVIKKI